MDEKRVEELVSSADRDCEEAIKLLERGDIYDAAEKAWSAIEKIRKACLVAAKIPYEIAKTTSKGLPLFIKILKALRRKDILKTYMYLSQQLHSLGFYERVIPESDLEDTIREDVPKWMQETKPIIKVLERADLSEVVSLLEEIDKTKQKILRTTSEYLALQQKLSQIITQQISNTPKVPAHMEKK